MKIFVRTVLLYIVVLVFVVDPKYNTVFAQPQWKATNKEWSGTRDWTFYQRINNYPYLEFRMDSLDTTDYFDCNYYHYLSDTSFPTISYADSIKAAEYMYWFWTLGNKYREFKPPKPPDPSSRMSLFSYLPHIQNKIDTSLLHKVIMESKTFKFGSLDFSDVYNLILTDALIKGEIIAKRYVRDTTRCLYYITEYVIQVSDVIHSYFDIKIGDKVLAASYCTGYAGGCEKNKTLEERLFGNCSHLGNHSVGDNLIFKINRNMYQAIVWHNWYQDKEIYCPQKFHYFSGREYTDKINDKIPDLKLFIKNIKYEKSQE